MKRTEIKTSCQSIRSGRDQLDVQCGEGISRRGNMLFQTTNGATVFAGKAFQREILDLLLENLDLKLAPADKAPIDADLNNSSTLTCNCSSGVTVNGDKDRALFSEFDDDIIVQLKTGGSYDHVNLGPADQRNLLNMLAAKLGGEVIDEATLTDLVEEATEVDGATFVATEGPDEESHVQVLACVSRVGTDSPDKDGDHLWVRSSPEQGKVCVATLLHHEDECSKTHPELKNQVILNRQSVINLVIQLTDWLMAGEEECSNTSTNDSSPDTVSPSESAVSSLELMAAMGSLTELYSSLMVELASSNSSSRANSSDHSNVCGKGC